MVGESNKCYMTPSSLTLSSVVETNSTECLPVMKSGHQTPLVGGDDTMCSLRLSLDSARLKSREYYFYTSQNLKFTLAQS